MATTDQLTALLSVTLLARRQTGNAWRNGWNGT